MVYGADKVLINTIKYNRNGTIVELHAFALPPPCASAGMENPIKRATLVSKGPRITFRSRRRVMIEKTHVFYALFHLFSFNFFLFWSGSEVAAIFFIGPHLSPCVARMSLWLLPAN